MLRFGVSRFSPFLAASLAIFAFEPASVSGQPGQMAPLPQCNVDSIWNSEAASRTFVTENRLANLIPEFGGAYYKSSVFNVYLTDTSAADRASRVIQANVRDVRGRQKPNFLKGAYTYKQLTSWTQCLIPYFAKGVVSWGPSGGDNRVRIQVIGDSTRQNIERGIAALGLPRDAFMFMTLPSRPEFVIDTSLIKLNAEVASVTIPDSLSAGEPFNIDFTTFGGGCTRDTARTEVAVLSRLAAETVVEVRPYDRRSTWPVCTLELRYLKHRAVAVVGRPGTAVVRIIGVQKDYSAESAGTSYPRVTQIERRIRVLPHR